eukprot:scaffold49021_cov66-Phaeocystis_antarctica.AAC.4
MGTAYRDAAGRTGPDSVELGAGILDGMSPPPGLHKWATSVTFTSALNFDAGHDSGAVWIMQIAGSLVLGAGAQMVLKNGAQASNIFWQIAGATSIPAGAHAEGILLCAGAIVLGAGASLNGRALTATAVTMIANTVVAPDLGGAAPPPPLPSFPPSPPP